MIPVTSFLWISSSSVVWCHMLHTKCNMLYLHNPTVKNWWAFNLNRRGLGSTGYFLNPCGCSTEYAALHFKSWAAGRSTIRNHHDRSRWPAAIAATEHVVSQQHPECLRVTSSRLSSPPQSVGNCDSPAATGASISARTLNCGWLLTQASGSDQTWPSWIPPGPTEEVCSRGPRSGRGPPKGGGGGGSSRSTAPVLRPKAADKKQERSSTCCQLHDERGVRTAELFSLNDSVIKRMERLADTERQDYQFNPKLPSPTLFSFPQWVTHPPLKHTHTRTHTHKCSNSRVIADVPPSTGG